MKKRAVIIAGGSGLIGTALSKHLTEKGHQVRILSRTPDQLKDYDSFYWDPMLGEMDVAVLEDAGYIINLAGANIAAKPWSAARKKLIIESRVKANLIFKKYLDKSHTIIKYVAASAIGYYGDHGETKIDESTGPTSLGFQSYSTVKWENAIMEAIPEKMSYSIIRTGVVLSTRGGPIGKLNLPARVGIIPKFGNGRQYLSWIHIDDIVNIYRLCLEDDNYTGIINAAVEAVTYKTFAEAIKKHITGFYQ